MGCGCDGKKGVTEINVNTSIPVGNPTLNIPESCAECPPVPGIKVCVTKQKPCGPAKCSPPCGRPGCCQPYVPASPAPYYANGCMEDHCNTVVQKTYTTALKVENQFNMPDCGNQAVLTIRGLCSIVLGSFLWNPNYGFLRVFAFDQQSGNVTIINDCISGNASAGTSIPACSLWVNTDPPADASSPGGAPTIFPYLAIDFTAPAVSTCINVTLTNVNGLAVGKNVTLAGGTYRLSAIISSTVVTICNDGAGVTPNTPVVAKNSAGEYQYPVILIDTNPCTNEATDLGVLIVCDAGIQRPLSGSPGQVPVVQNEDGEVSMETLDVPVAVCTELLCCFSRLEGVAEYIMPVADTSVFVVGDVVWVGGSASVYRWVILEIIDETHMRVEIVTGPAGSTEDYPEGTPVCVRDCCELLNAKIQEQQADVDQDGDEATGTVSQASPLVQTATQSISFSNPSTFGKNMRVFYTAEAYLVGNVDNANTTPLSYDFRLLVGEGVPPTAGTGGIDTVYMPDDNLHGISRERHLSGEAIITPGNSLTINAVAEIEWISGATSEFELAVPNGITCRITGIAVLV